jgi:hypothetical protein
LSKYLLQSKFESDKANLEKMLEEQSKLKPCEKQVNVSQPKMMAVEG